MSMKLTEFHLYPNVDLLTICKLPDSLQEVMLPILFYI